MAKIAEVQEVPRSSLVPYERNAKIHSPEQVQKIADSIEEFGFVSPCLIDRDFNIIAGHGRVMAAELLGMETVPCVFVEGLTDEQRRAYILADNRLTELGEWDMGTVEFELQSLVGEGFDIELTGFDFTSWFDRTNRWDTSREEGNDEYNEFLDKFEQPKTTDDCYTPENIYDIVAEYVETRYGKKRSEFIRPFYPGGDYESEDYAGKVVVDNPPFSILANIVDFYAERKHPFFLFAPGLATLNCVNRDGVAAICTYAGVTYENGASVSTSFLTNLEPETVAARSDAELFQKLDKANKANEAAMRKSFPKYDYPYEVLTAAKMGYLSKYGQSMTILRKDSVFIRAMDAQKEEGKGIYGGALLLSERAAAERAAAVSWPLSDREKEIVRALGGDDDGE